MPCKIVKYTPKRTVIVIAKYVSNNFLSIKVIWAQVMVAPLLSKTVVFKRGTSKGLIGVTPLGGHTEPISKVGEREEWK